MNFCAFQAGTENIAPWKDVLKLATVTDNAKPIMHWNGNVGVSLDGLVKVVKYQWNKIALIDVTMIKVGPKNDMKNAAAAADHINFSLKLYKERGGSRSTQSFYGLTMSL